MPSKRLTMYLTEESMKTIGPAENLSGRVNGIIGHYSRMTAEAAPALTTGEWFFLMDMLNGTFIEDNTGDHLWADISESGRLDGLGEKWEVDAEAFAAKIRAMPHAARCAILDVVLRYWKGDEDPTDGRSLTAAGAKIAE